MVNIETIRAELARLPYSLTREGIGAITSWRRGGGPRAGEDILIGSDGNPATLACAATIETSGFFAGPDHGYDPGHIPEYHARLGPVGAYALGKASAILGAVPSMITDFELAMSNLESICGSAPNCKAVRMGIFNNDGDQVRAKVGHVFFELRSGRTADQVPLLPVDGEQSIELADSDQLDLDTLPEFRIANWPCAIPCQPFRDAIVATHKVVPLPAFMRGSDKPILPTDYVRLLRGAVVEIHFTLTHKVLRRQTPVSFFSLAIDEIIVLQEHVPADLSPSRARLASRFLMPKADSAEEPGASGSKPTKRRRV